MLKITRSKATELAREGLAIRRNAIMNCKPAVIGLIVEGSDLYVCSESEYSVATISVVLLDVRYDDTIKAISDKIYSLNKR